MIATFRVAAVGPLVTFQDAGRPGYLRYGVPRSGPMDRLAHAAANQSLGNPAGATAVEVSNGGLTLDCIAGTATTAVTGLGSGGAWQGRTVSSGDRLVISAQGAGSWSYVAFAGDLQASSWLGSTATHSQSGLGGGALRKGDELHISAARVDRRRDGEIPQPPLPPASAPVRVVMGPQTHCFAATDVAAFDGATYSLSAGYDRMGVRLDGPRLDLGTSLSIPSEPIVPGSVQVGGDGTPTILLADHQTTGGYPKIATIVSADLDRVSQLRPGDPITFSAIDPAGAIELARRHDSMSQSYLGQVSRLGRTLTHRLMFENLITTADPFDV